jgi:hypothetical protein
MAKKEDCSMMTRISFADALETASKQVDTAIDQEIASLLRNAATRIRNSSTITLDADVDFSLAEMAMEFRIPKEELIRKILKDWVEANYLSFALDDDKPEIGNNKLSNLRH